jgi:pilus assembly protein CpaF
MERTLSPALVQLIECPSVTDLCFNRHDEIFFNRGDGFEKLASVEPVFQSESEYRKFILDEISRSGKTWDAKLPFLDAVFFGTHRAHVAFPPLSPHGISLSLRKLPTRQKKGRHEAQQIAAQRWQSSSVPFAMLVDAVEKHETVILAGATGSGKTTLLNDLASFIPDQERIITLEDTAELCPQHPHWISLLSRTANADGFGAVTLRDLVKQTLRMKADRVLVGECRGDEVMDLLQALNTGHRGTLSTIHANSSREAIKRLELLAMIGSNGAIPLSLIRELIIHSIQKIAFVENKNIAGIIQLERLEREVFQTRTLYSNSSGMV